VKVLETVLSHLTCIEGVKRLRSKRQVFHLAKFGGVNRCSHRSRKIQAKKLCALMLTWLRAGDFILRVLQGLDIMMSV